MTTIAAEVPILRRILQDFPDEDYATTAPTTTSDTDFIVNDVTKWAAGQVWEFDDDTGEQVLVRNVDSSSSTITVKRSARGSTAATHSDDVVLLNAPRFTYDMISQAINTVLDADLYNEGVYEIAEHQVTSSATTNAYNAPSSSCIEFLDVYQRISSTDSPMSVMNFTRLPRNADTTLWSEGKVFEIYGNYGTPGSSVYYVSCKHRHTITTLTAQVQRAVEFLACAYLLEWTEPRRVAGPTNQGDRTVRAGQGIGTGAYYRGLAKNLIAQERAQLKSLVPAYRTFRKII